jgi:ABC-type Fe3+-hydroxamate transport system substrate-binding protein
VNILLFIAQLTHSPELCFGRSEHKEKAKKLMEFMKNMEKYEKEAGVKVQGFYLNSNEHTFYVILEGDTYGKISKFLGFEPVLTHHTAKITPIVALEEIVKFAKDVVGE